MHSQQHTLIIEANKRDVFLMQDADGNQVLRRLRASSTCRSARALIVSFSGSNKDREPLRDLGVDEYFRKLANYNEFMKLGPL